MMTGRPIGPLVFLLGEVDFETTPSPCSPPYFTQTFQIRANLHPSLTARQNKQSYRRSITVCLMPSSAEAAGWGGLTRWRSGMCAHIRSRWVCVQCMRIVF